jgi:1,2-diacylglycerol 3-alpha-glucosyltransferase
MRIGIFTNCYYPMVNGVVGAVALLRQGFLEAGHEVYIFAPDFDDYQDTEAGIFRYPALDLTNRVKYPVAVPFSSNVKRELKRLELDIIHSHHPFVLGRVGLRLARRRKIPIVYTFHTQYDQYTHYVPLPGSLVSWFSTRQVRHFSRAVDQVTTPSESARRVLLEYGVTTAVKVIPNPIDLDKFITNDGISIRQKYHLSRQQKLLINIGRVAPEKNLNLLLKSFQQMLQHMLAKEASHTLKLMIVGEGPELPNLIQLASELGIQDDVIFTGLVEPVLIPQYLAAADLFVMTSTTEVKPLSQLEALASGVPIVAVSAAGANDTIVHGENGLLTPENPLAFAEAVLSLIADPKRYGYLQENARKTASQYAYSAIVVKYLALFEQLIREKRG